MEFKLFMLGLGLGVIGCLKVWSLHSGAGVQDEAGLVGSCTAAT